MSGYRKVKKGEIFTSNPTDLYYFAVDRTGNDIAVENGDSAWFIKDGAAHTVRGPAVVQSDEAVTIIRGYAPRNQMVSILGGTNLPYVNGCSSEQIIAPIRQGDPTLQTLFIPSFSGEQSHHIHATARVCYIIKGSGKSIIGMKGQVELPLYEADVLVLDRMVPHHFTTEVESLTVCPLHIFSSTVMEQNHPMFNGTILTE
jgi:hypothetical protein